jgi:molybdopterin converting factor small subunit
MAVTVRIPSYLAGFAGGQNEIAVQDGVANVRELLEKVWQIHPALKDRVVDEQGEIRQHINIFVDGEAIRLSGNQETPVPKNADVMIVPAVSGGTDRFSDIRRWNNA